MKGCMVVLLARLLLPKGMEPSQRQSKEMSGTAER